jgi:hypothetical protein
VLGLRDRLRVIADIAVVTSSSTRPRRGAVDGLRTARAGPNTDKKENLNRQPRAE